MSSYDLVVLGAGTTGLSAAREARRKGRSVALVEAARPGGDCTHYGCVPSKSLIETARRVHAARSGPSYGFTADPEVDFGKVMARVHAVIAEIEQDESPEQLAREGIELVRGWGEFVSEGVLEVDGRRLTSKHFVVATGSAAAVPPIDGLGDHLDNKTVFDLTELPEHLLVLGGGNIGVELCQAFRRLGSRVTVVESGPTILPKDEPEAQRALTTVLEREGVTLRLNARAERVSAGPTLHLSDGSTVSGSHLLVAVGRQPSTSGFGLDRLGVALDDSGRVVVDKHLQAAPTVWAAGDCTAKLQFTHVGDEQGRLAAKNAFGSVVPGTRIAWDDEVVPWVTFTEPEVAHVGLSEQQAYERHGADVRVSYVPDTASDRARTAGETDGFVKLMALPAPVVGMGLGSIIGMTVVGPMAGEQVAQGALAMRSAVRAFRLAQTITAYPTWSISTRVAAARLFRPQGGQVYRAARPS